MLPLRPQGDVLVTHSPFFRVIERTPLKGVAQLYWPSPSLRDLGSLLVLWDHDHPRNAGLTTHHFQWGRNFGRRFRYCSRATAFLFLCPGRRLSDQVFSSPRLRQPSLLTSPQATFLVSGLKVPRPLICRFCSGGPQSFHQRNPCLIAQHAVCWFLTSDLWRPISLSACRLLSLYGVVPESSGSLPISNFFLGSVCVHRDAFSGGLLSCAVPPSPRVLRDSLLFIFLVFLEISRTGVLASCL